MTMRTYLRTFAYEEVCLILVYALTCIVAIALSIADSPAMQELLVWPIVYQIWLVPYAFSATSLVAVMIGKEHSLEMLCIPLTAAGTFTYALAITTHPPSGNLALGVAIGGAFMVAVTVLTFRFFHLYLQRRRPGRVE